jgi:prepilin-type N-terminal cleavage/methylation domain-containing protein
VLHDANGMTMIELCIVIVIVGILMVAGAASLMRARMSSNETAAIAALRTVNSAEFAYATGCGSGNYATSFLVLGLKPPGNSQGYLSEDLGAAAMPKLHGYTFSLAAGSGASAAPVDCNGTATQTKYYASGEPSVMGQTGNRSFATNQGGAIWGLNGASAPVEPFAAPATFVQ